MDKSLSIDQILERCGSFGRYQFMLMGFFCLINVLCSMHYYSQTIISFVPEHWCLSEATANLSTSALRQSFAQSKSTSCMILSKSQQEIPCNEWIYDFDFLFGYRSMTSDLNWVCQHAWKSIAGQSTYFIGSVIGTLVLGILADTVGRLPILILAHLFGIIGNVLTIFATNEIAFALCRFISGIATDNNFVMMYILVLEYIAPRMRTFGLNLCIGVFYCLGSVVTPWLAVWLGNWKQYLIATIVPALVVPAFYFIIPESAEWLIARNRIDEALICYQKIAVFNRRQLDEKFIEDFKNCASSINENRIKSNERSPSLLALFKTPRLRRLTLILFFKSMIITLGYDAISKNVEGLGISPFILFSLSASAILPACLILLLLQDKIGRKAMASSSLLVSGVFISVCGIILAYQNDQNPVTLGVLSIIGRLGVTVAYNSGAQYATELIPTCIRAQGVAATHVAGYGLTFFSSYILYTATFFNFKAMPSLILGVLSFAGAFCCLFLPETLNRKTPITLNDGEEFGRGEKFFHFACFEKVQSEKSELTKVPS